MKRTPIIHPIVRAYIENANRKSVTQNHTHPCKVSFPVVFEQNVQAMQDTLEEQMIEHKIYFANKATKSDTFVRAALQSGIGIDVSSEQELKDALALGYTGADIVANGPKSVLFLRLCLEYDVMISVDSLGEIRKILDLNITTSQSKTMLRIRPSREISVSRFGITEQEIIEHQTLILQLDSLHAIYGVNFHIDTTNSQDKQRMIRHMIDIREVLVDRDIHIEQLGIGGGLGVQYVHDLLDQQSPREYPQGPRLYGIDGLHELLEMEIESDLTFKKYLIETMTMLHLEPGRTLLDQCGICVHHILDKKDGMIVIDGNMYSLGSIGQEMTHDPWTPTLSDDSIGDAEYDIYGNLCLEADKIFSRKISLPGHIAIGDVIIFVNTAAYFSDFSDSQPIKHSDRKEIVVS